MNPKITVEKLDNSSAIKGTIQGTIEASFESVVSAICDLEAHSTYADTINKQLVLTNADVDILIKSPPSSTSEAEKAIKNLGQKSNEQCTHKAYTLTIVDLPFPLRNSWGLLKFASKNSDGVFELEQTQVAGKSEQSDAYWKIEQHPESTIFYAEFINDLGFAPPQFVLNVFGKRQLKTMFEKIANASHTLSNN